MEFILGLVSQSIAQVILTLQHNWPFLVISVLVATLLKFTVDAHKVSAFLNRYRSAGILAATAAAVATPLCSCGTTAVVLGMMASSMPWAPIVAFMVASPLTSPEGLVYSAGLFGWPFAWAFYLASILLGLGGGYLAMALEKRGWLANQTRFSEPAPAACPCGADGAALAGGRSYGLEFPAFSPKSSQPERSVKAAECGCAPAQPACACSGSDSNSTHQGALAETEQKPAECACAAQPAQGAAKPALTPLGFAKELFSGAQRLLFMFLGFAFIGYFLNGLIPASWVATLFGGGHAYSVPLAATLGLPFYINSESSLPLIRAMLDSGMSQGAALAFLIAGAGTSIGAITGALTIARWRVIGLVVGVLWIGAILSGLVFDLLLNLKLF